MIYKMIKEIKLSSCIITFLSSIFLAFGLYHVHSFSKVTEGGVLGLTLLLDYWFDLSPAVSGFILNAICYLVGRKLLGKKFIIYSAVSTVGFSVSYKIFEYMPPLFPNIGEYPLFAAILGALFVGIGVGICVRIGGALGGDDALAMSISHLTHIKIQWVYLISDILVLGLSLSYIPLDRILYSLLTVVLSGQIVGFMQKTEKKKEKTLEKS